jgi:hypothetical protein
MKASLQTLRDMATRLGASTKILRKRLASSKCKNVQDKEGEGHERRVAEVLVRKLRKDDREDQESVVELRLAVIGGQDGGKSTLLGERISRQRLR